MNLVYLPNIGFKLDSSNEIIFKWGNEREEIRHLLNNSHIADDDEDYGQKRDIYQNAGELMLLNYDDSNYLNELEIHKGVDININGIILKFGDDVNNILKRLQSYDKYKILDDDGTFLLPSMKMAIGNGASMGGEDDNNSLEYFYASANIDHLMEI
ncbi:unnamed protein product [Didymodactylos carnosus]|uniref:Uncharacterized protein n=1 Tax=Didymodactylos carnosus TaxID=1234261 RepID=A0A814CMW6_9BILA|nr:unnamed protein product [Didymodactylos carnosus]CAF3718613.1 unnamed protein product [Didymodactylos carnosus]